MVTTEVAVALPCWLCGTSSGSSESPCTPSRHCPLSTSHGLDLVSHLIWGLLIDHAFAHLLGNALQLQRRDLPVSPSSIRCQLIKISSFCASRHILTCHLPGALTCLCCPGFLARLSLHSSRLIFLPAVGYALSVSFRLAVAVDGLWR